VDGGKEFRDEETGEMIRRSPNRAVIPAIVALIVASCGGSAASPSASSSGASAPASAPPAASEAPAASGGASASAASTGGMTKEEIAAALTSEGTVTIKSWGFNGLSKTVFPDAFKQYTQDTYGVPVTLVWDDTNGALQQAEQANKLPSEIGLDVIDSEEDHMPQLQELGWIEKINDPKYDSVLTNWAAVDPAYVVQDGLGIIYQGFEDLSVVARKDKVDVAAIKDWTDLADPALKGKIVMYPIAADPRGQALFYAMLTSLIKEGTVQGSVTDPASITAGLQWFKKNLEPNVLQFADIDVMRTKLQSGEIGVALTWNSYIRGILASDWNVRDNVAVPIYPASGSPGDRETLRVAKGTKHPVAARVLINWMLSQDFIMAGWTQDPATGTETNKWNLSQQDYLQAYFGGINAEQRKLAPKWAAPYYPTDPAAVTLTLDFSFAAKNNEKISNEYKALK
jgi:ABC-type Fe3+ transport system substrate-binding protein